LELARLRRVVLPEGTDAAVGDVKLLAVGAPVVILLTGVGDPVTLVERVGAIVIFPNGIGAIVMLLNGVGTPVTLAIVTLLNVGAPVMLLGTIVTLLIVGAPVILLGAIVRLLEVGAPVMLLGAIVTLLNVGAPVILLNIVGAIVTLLEVGAPVMLLGAIVTLLKVVGEIVTFTIGGDCVGAQVHIGGRVGTIKQVIISTSNSHELLFGLVLLLLSERPPFCCPLNVLFGEIKQLATEQFSVNSGRPTHVVVRDEDSNEGLFPELSSPPSYSILLDPPVILVELQIVLPVIVQITSVA